MSPENPNQNKPEIIPGVYCKLINNNEGVQVDIEDYRLTYYKDPVDGEVKLSSESNQVKQIGDYEVPDHIREQAIEVANDVFKHGTDSLYLDTTKDTPIDEAKEHIANIKASLDTPKKD